MQLLLHHLPYFLLFFFRITAFFIVAPVYSTRGVPTQFKIGLGFFVSLIVYSVVKVSFPIAWDGAYLLLILQETLVGLLLGFIAYLFFTAVQVAGSFVDVQMGFGIVNVIDPATGAQSPILGNFKFIIAILLFLSMDGHHFMLLSIMKSYEWISITGNVFGQLASGEVTLFLIKSFAVMFALAFQMSAPLVASLFVVDVGLGILARTVPQFNVFVVGLPIKIIVGFTMLFLMIPSYLFLFRRLFQTMFDAIEQMLLIMGV